MSRDVSNLDLIVLAADGNIEHTFKGLLSRPEALGITAIRYDIKVHPDRDPGCRLRSGEFLQGYLNVADRALVIFDHEGSGAKDGTTAVTLETRIESELAARGWETRAAVVVLDPELEAWVWSDSPHVEDILGWQGRSPTLREWLIKRDHLAGDAVKPQRPKEAVEAALWESRKARSSSLYEKLARQVSFRRCEDRAFKKLRATLSQWFPPRLST